jgi:hypothetical protein
MPAINPALIPTITPGDLFRALTVQDSLNIRWLYPNEPAYYEILNRPLADIAVRQLVIAKTADQLSASLGKQVRYPFLIQPRIVAGSDAIDVPVNIIWDISAAMPVRWERLRLAKIKRLSGANPDPDLTGDQTGAGNFSGKLRLIFTASSQNSSAEVAIFQADYLINSSQSYQSAPLSVVIQPEETNVLTQSARSTVAGHIVLKTLDTNDLLVQNFLQLVKPDEQAAVDNTGTYLEPLVYELVDSVPGDLSGDFTNEVVRHGTGMLADSAWTAVPPADSDIVAWITAFNYPFDANASRTSTNGITIPAAIFQEFNMTVPAGDEPAGDTSGTFFPVWLNRIERISTGRQIRCYFATHNVTDSDDGGNPSLDAIEFASLDLLSDMPPGEIVEIAPINNLQLQIGSDAALFNQHFGRGHVVLSSLWSPTSATIDDFFTAFDDSVTDIDYAPSATRLSSFALSRVPKYTPSIGQAQALKGSTSHLVPAVHPGADNRYVTEQDQGLGERIDLESQTGITPHPAIDRYADAGALCHRLVRLIVKSNLVTGGDNTFYETTILPRLRILLGRDPIFGDEWYNGTRFLKYNGDSWQG